MLRTRRSDTALEDVWRAQFLKDLAGATSDPSIRAELNSEAVLASGRLPTVPHATQPTFASPSPAAWCRGLHQSQRYDCSYEVASAYAATSLNDNRQERAYIACVSMLAIALFLFALSKMLSQPSMERLFLGLGALVTLAAVAWIVALPFTTPASAPSGIAIQTYERGWQMRAGRWSTGHRRLAPRQGDLRGPLSGRRLAAAR